MSHAGCRPGERPITPTLSPRSEGAHCRRGEGFLQLALPVHLALLLPLSLLLSLLLGMMAAVETAGGGAEDAVMAGIVAGDAADDGALDAALGVGGGGRATDEKCGDDGGEGFHGSISPDAVSRSQRTRLVTVPGARRSRLRARPCPSRAPAAWREFVQARDRTIPDCSHEPGIALARHRSAISPVVLRIAGFRSRALALRKLHTANEDGRNDGREAQSPARAASARRHRAQ